MLWGCQLDMEIRHIKQQFKHEHYIKGRRLALMVLCTRFVCASKSVPVCFFVSVTQQTQQTQHLAS